MFNELTIGLDTGNYGIKTVHTDTCCGFSKKANKPSDEEGKYLFYNGSYYVESPNIFPYTKDKTENENFIVLSLIGIAKEIIFRVQDNANIPMQQKIDNIRFINLGIGLPPTHVSKYWKSYEDYYKSRFSGGVSFEYSGYKFNFQMKKIKVYPQDFAAIVAYKNKKEDSILGYSHYVAVDIGGYTVDVLKIMNGKIDMTSCDSLEMGVNKMCEEIRVHVENDTGSVLDQSMIETILKGNKTILPSRIVEYVHSSAQGWFDTIIDKIRQKGIDFSVYPVVFIGGGSILLSKYFANNTIINNPGYDTTTYELIEDSKANAIGYEKLLTAELSKVKDVA